MKYLLLLLGLLGLSFTPPPTILNVGDKAPNISVKDVFDQKLNIKKLLNENDQVLLVFLRHAWCPVCNARTHEMLQNYSTLKAKGIEVVVVYQSKKDGLVDYVEDYKLPYKVIADPDCELYELYGLVDDKKNAFNSFQNNATTKKLMKKGMAAFGKNKKSKYKKKDDKDRFYMPGDFLIGKNGKITSAYYGKFLGDHWPVEEILATNSKAVPAAKTTTSKKEKEAGSNIRF